MIAQLVGDWCVWWGTDIHMYYIHIQSFVTIIYIYIYIYSLIYIYIYSLIYIYIEIAGASQVAVAIPVRGCYRASRGFLASLSVAAGSRWGGYVARRAGATSRPRVTVKIPCRISLREQHGPRRSD
jgi:hypothetical protein